LEELCPSARCWCLYRSFYDISFRRCFSNYTATAL